MNKLWILFGVVLVLSFGCCGASNSVSNQAGVPGSNLDQSNIDDCNSLSTVQKQDGCFSSLKSTSIGYCLYMSSPEKVDKCIVDGIVHTFERWNTYDGMDYCSALNDKTNAPRNCFDLSCIGDKDKTTVDWCYYHLAIDSYYEYDSASHLSRAEALKWCDKIQDEDYRTVCRDRVISKTLND